MSGEARKTVLVTGCAGFVGSFLCARLLCEENLRVVGLDNMYSYYDIELKRERLAMVQEAASGSFELVRADVDDADAVEEVFATYQPDVVVHLAAQAGVRYSLEAPRVYVKANVSGFLNVLEACRNHPVKHLVYASSSSVYGLNEKTPFSEQDKTDRPASLYAATKKAGELMAHAYANTFGVPSTGLRFFTVYGPMGRPDMAYYKFALLMKAGKPIQIYNGGNMLRDFTYVGDVVEGIRLVVARALEEPAGEEPVCRLYNLGHGSPVRLMDFVSTLEERLLAHGVISEPPVHELLPMQPGDVTQTYADTSAFQRDFGFVPQTSYEEGLDRFAEWFSKHE